MNVLLFLFSPLKWFVSPVWRIYKILVLPRTGRNVLVSLSYILITTRLLGGQGWNSYLLQGQTPCFLKILPLQSVNVSKLCTYADRKALFFVELFMAVDALNMTENKYSSMMPFGTISEWCPLGHESCLCRQFNGNHENLSRDHSSLHTFIFVSAGEGFTDREQYSATSSSVGRYLRVHSLLRSFNSKKCLFFSA